MNQTSPITKIRFFEFPQVFISIEKLDKSERWFNRHINEICPELLSGASIKSILDDCLQPQTIKIEARQHVTSSFDYMTSDDIVEFYKQSKIVRPCKNSTIARIFLSNLGPMESLPSMIRRVDYCLAINKSGMCFKISFKEKKIICQAVPRKMQINPDALLIMETDPV